MMYKCKIYEKSQSIYSIAMLSVVIPLYNKEKSIVATLQSVLAQTYTDYEVIIVDDGSTDNSLQVVRERICELGTNRVRVIHQENAGVSSARNRGIEEAKGEYVAFLDGDDLWTPDYLDTLASLIKDYPNVGLYSLGYALSDDKMPRKKIEEGSYRGKICNPWNSQYAIWTGSSSSSSRERLIKVGLFDTRMTHGEDLDMWWRLVLDGGLVVDTKCCAFYRQDTENRAMNKNIPLEKHIPYYIDKFADARTNNKEFRKFFDEQMIYRLYLYLFDRNYRKEAQRLAKKLDYSQLKWTMHFRMLFPYIYRLITRR